MANWELVGELTVTNSWQFFPNNVIGADNFKISTTIQNQDDWNIWKFRSGAYLRFYYADGSVSQNYYVKVTDLPVIRVFPVTSQLADNGYLIRAVAIIRASRYLPLTPGDMFAQWRLRLEAFQ